ncbi:MAG: Hsp20/alpha crystallin family protein [Pseudomonadales bacterium]
MSEVARNSAAEPTSGGRGEVEPSRQTVLRPAGDIFEHDHGITLVLDMPGVSRERLNIQSDRNNLTVEGELEISMPEGTESLHADIRSTHYQRSFSLSGEQLDTESIEASLKDGVLRIDIPKRAEVRPRKIEVTTG